MSAGAVFKLLANDGKAWAPSHGEASWLSV